MIALRKMTAEEFEQYLSTAVANYANEHVLAGTWTREEALGQSEKQYATLLPDGADSAGNYLYTIVDDEEAVGMIWLKKKSGGEGFILDLYIWERHQGKGFSKQAMQRIEEEGRKLGLKKIGLHVFGHNKTARALYEKLGYTTKSIIMSKDIAEQ